ncbi:hypothetical protein ACDA63_03540 [Uliginosibacterium sp. sgz301328]|uniref:hypothetical protein n=1 Tax=Uliginosibacterium sp. sgz301328 TaxID=3243764 RepID=UPI00359D1489
MTASTLPATALAHTPGATEDEDDDATLEDDVDAALDDALEAADELTDEVELELRDDVEEDDDELTPLGLLESLLLSSPPHAVSMLSIITTSVEPATERANLFIATSFVQNKGRHATEAI